jgi:hypothetical protein
MTSTTGAFMECFEYARNHDLPIVFIIEDNSKSVCTESRKVWNTYQLQHEPDEVAQGMLDKDEFYKTKWLWYYKYNLSAKYKHAGTNVRVQF